MKIISIFFKTEKLSFFSFFSDIFYFAYRVRLGFAATAESVLQGPDTHAEAHDESTSGYHWYQSHRHVLRRWRGGGCTGGWFRAQCRTLHFVHLDVLFRDVTATAADVVILVFLGFRLFQFEFRGFEILLCRQRR